MKFILAFFFQDAKASFSRTPDDELQRAPQNTGCIISRFNINKNFDVSHLGHIIVAKTSSDRMSFTFQCVKFIGPIYVFDDQFVCFHSTTELSYSLLFSPLLDFSSIFSFVWIATTILEYPIRSPEQRPYTEAPQAIYW